jgi:ABC-type branched-subunit amino acid transport system substrate-binding protein
MIGLAGCLSSLNNEAPDQITFGATVPLSVPFELNGRKQRTAIQNATDHAMEQDDVDAGVEVLLADSKNDPAVAQRQAQGHLNEGADVTTGGVSSAVAASLGELAMRRSHLHLGGAGDAGCTSP